MRSRAARLRESATADAAPPEKLSRVRPVCRQRQHARAGWPGVIPYDLNSPLFSDYTDKFRFVKLPAGHAGQVQRRRGVRVSRRHDHRQDVCLSRRRPRSRGRAPLARNAHPQARAEGWVGLPYIWNAEQTEAVLDVAGDLVDVSWIDAGGEQRTNNYIIPNSNQCKGCHKQGDDLLPIGPKARHLNRDFAYADGSENQLAYWTRVRRSLAAPPPQDAPRLAVWNDPATGTLDERARAWLEINCAHCHNPAGPAATRAWT